MKGKSVDEFCNSESGTFNKFVKEKEAHLRSLEAERKQRIRTAKAANQELALAA